MPYDDPEFQARLRQAQHKYHDQIAHGGPIHLAAYERISSDGDGEEAGVTRQHEDLCELVLDVLIAREHLNVVTVTFYRDNDRGASMFSRKPRPDYQVMITDTKAGRRNMISSYSTSRLTRRPRENEDHIELAQPPYGITYRFIKAVDFDLNSWAGRAMARTMATMDAAYAEQISELISRAKRQARENGEFHGTSRPFGWERDGLTPRDDEAELINRAIDTLFAGAALKSVARHWQEKCPPNFWHIKQVQALIATDPADARSEPERALIIEARARVEQGERPRAIMHGWIDRREPRPGATWKSTGVRSILMSPRNAGLMRQPDGSYLKAAWPAIVTEDRWRAVCALLTDPTRYHGKSNSRRWQGSGVYWCGECGSEMRSGSRKRDDPIYRCRASDSHSTIDARVVDDVVNQHVRGMLETHGAALLARTPQMDTAGTRAEAANVRARLEEAADAYAAGDLTLRDWKRASDKLNATLAELEWELATVAAGSPLDGIADADDPVAAYDALTDIEQRRAVLAAVITVTILPAKAVPSMAGQCVGKGRDGAGHHLLRTLARIRVDSPWLGEPTAA